MFSGTATNAPLFPGANPDLIRLTGVMVLYQSLHQSQTFTRLSIITGMAGVTTGAGGASNWTFTVTPFPGTNILSVQCVDVSGDISPVASVSLFLRSADSIDHPHDRKWNRRIQYHQWRDAQSRPELLHYRQTHVLGIQQLDDVRRGS